ncbi:MAG: anthranilate phosphoribosyltransferase [Patescibacteria group bacterium]|jgi:anthranilate phosphoribosyltransferase
MINEILKLLKGKKNLTREQACEMQMNIIEGQLAKDEIIGIFKSFEEKEMTEEELAGIVEATRKKMARVKIDFDTLDNCGTGGDGFSTFNISTVSAIVCAAAGIPVAKHGNRAASSECGSADVLEKLGVKINLDPDQAKECLKEAGIVFMFAPNFHPALRHVKDARAEYGKKTYFNILGPMLNPAQATHQLIGLADASKAGIIAKTLIQTGAKKVILVHGKEGLDEVSIGGDTELYTYENGRAARCEINPRDFGLKLYNIEEIKGGGADQNAKIFLNVLNGKATEAQLNAVLLNSAAGMLAFGKAGKMEEGIKLAKDMIESGKALSKLKDFIEISNKV